MMDPDDKEVPIALISNKGVSLIVPENENLHDIREKV